jgi:hypothetical protein
MRLQYRLEPAWPVQSWLAECHADRVIVRHGRRVETRPQWFCEAAWDGPFEHGDFDRTDVVAGTGGRLRGDAVVFVPTGSTTDRLASIDLPSNERSGGQTLVSNSLACLLRVAGANPSPTYRHYRRDIQTIIRGLERYKKSIDTSEGPCRLWYFHNLRWDGRGLSLVEKPEPERDFSAYEPYIEFVTSALRAVARNAGDPGRRHAIGLVSTMSKGYDSTAVTTLARDVGLQRILTVAASRHGNNDSGEEVAGHLGLETVIIDRERWKQYSFPEVPFLAIGGENDDRVLLSAEEHLRGNLVFTGFHGDKIWGKSPYGPDSLLPHPEIKRGDISGLTQTEYRLSAGYINCPVPFWGCRKIHEVVRISRDPSMRPWDVPGDYSRPICRRIAETAGVPREAFGIQKLVGSARELVLVDASRHDYQAWCRRHGIEGDLFDRAVRRAIGTLPGKIRRPVRAMFYTRTPTVRDYMFQWAVERQGELYRSSQHDVRTPSGADSVGDDYRTAHDTGRVQDFAGAVG